MSGSVTAITPATSPSGMSWMPQPRARSSAISFSWRGPVEHADDDLVRRDALGRGDRADILGRALGEVDHAVRIAGADRELVHIDVGGVEQAALLGDGEHGQRVGAGLGGDRGALERIERDVDARAGALRGADPLADEQHRRLVALALADHHRAVDVERVQRRAHRLDRGMIGRLLVAAADQLRRRHRRRLGHPDHLQHQHAIENMACLDHLLCHPPARTGAFTGGSKRGP